MGVPTVITDLSTTAASNSPAGGDSIGTSLDDYLRAGFAFERQMFDTATIYSSTVGGTADVITLTPSPALIAYKAGQAIAWIQSGANTTNVTVNVSGLGAKAVTKGGATALAASDLPSGAMVVARYDGTQFQLESATITLSPPFIDSTAIIKGSGDSSKLLKIEVDGLTTATTRTWTAPDADLTVVGTATTQTLTNKALSDSTTTIVDDGDATKKLAFQCSGITTGTTRTVTIPDKSGTMGMTSDILVKQRVSTITGAAATGTTTIPSDDTIPQNTEGDQYMSLAITPNNSSNILVIDVVVNLASSAAGGDMVAALFQDSTANALAVAGVYNANSGHGQHITFRHIMSAGTTSSTTFKVRAGNSNAGTTTFNGSAGARLYGGVYASSIMITEYAS